jgi:hypothetical protein
MADESAVTAQTIGYSSLLCCALFLMAWQMTVFTGPVGSSGSAGSVGTYIPMGIIIFICTLMVSFNTIYRQRLVEHRVSSSVYSFYWTIVVLLSVHVGLLGYTIMYTNQMSNPKVIYGLTVLLGTVSVLITSTIGIILHYYSNDE